MNQSLVSRREQRNASAVIDEQIAHTEANLAKLDEEPDRDSCAVMRERVTFSS